jgi:hypothetical protein
LLLSSRLDLSSLFILAVGIFYFLCYKPYIYI